MKNNDAGNRGEIEVKSKQGSKKLVVFLGIVAAVLISFIAVVSIFKKPAEVKQTGLEKDDNETLVSKTNTNNTLDSMMNLIEQKKAREKQEAEQQRLEDEAKKAKKPEPEQSDAISQMTMADTAGSRTAGQSNQRNDKDRPLTKSERQLIGDTLVKMDKQTTTAKADEKDALQGTKYANGSVSPVLNRKYLLPAGYALSCVLQTKVVTSYPGITLCQLMKDVYSDDGTTLLARAGATLMGEQNKAITQGIARVFINWTTLKSENINVRIDALGTDSLGASGVPAWIDAHLLQRWGGAIMLSLVGDGMDILKNSTTKSSDNSGNITYDNTSSAMQDMAKTTLDNTINIAPTAVINQGTVISIIVPRNIDFSSVYEVR